MVAPGNRAWGAPNAQNSASAKISIDDSTKLFQKYLEDTAPKPQKTIRSSNSRVQGGLPPHVLKLREHTDERMSSRTPQAMVGAFLLLLPAYSLSCEETLTRYSVLTHFLPHWILIASHARLLGHREHSRLPKLLPTTLSSHHPGKRTFTTGR